MSRPITVLVEGESDKAAVENLAPRYGVDLADLGATVVSMGGAGNFGRFIAEATSQRHCVGGLYDEGEERFVLRALNRQEGDDVTKQGFFACRRDLEDELIRAIGATEVVALLEAEGELHGFHTFANQPEHRSESVEAQLHRFLGTKAGRKIRYGTVLGQAVALDRIPEPLEGLFMWLWG